MQVNSHTIAFLAKMQVILFCCQPQGWFHGHGLFTTIDGMKYEGGECAPSWRDKKSFPKARGAHQGGKLQDMIPICQFEKGSLQFLFFDDVPIVIIISGDSRVKQIMTRHVGEGIRITSIEGSLTIILIATIIAQEFRAGRIWGHGLLTFSDGSSSSEGYFQVGMLVWIFQQTIENQEIQ